MNKNHQLEGTRMTFSKQLLLLLFSCAAVPFAQDSQCNKEIGYISVQGEAVIEKKPDEFQIYFSIELKDSNLSRAKISIDPLSKKIVAESKKFGIDTAFGIKSELSVKEDRNYRTNEFFGYSVGKKFIVAVADHKRVDPYIDMLLKSGVNHISGVMPVVNDLSSAQTEAMKLAIKNAQARANLLAKEMDLKIGKANYASPDFGRLKQERVYCQFDDDEGYRMEFKEIYARIDVKYEIIE